MGSGPVLKETMTQAEAYKNGRGRQKYPGNQKNRKTVSKVFYEQPVEPRLYGVINTSLGGG